jgi:hypothetical protein
MTDRRDATDVGMLLAAVEALGQLANVAVRDEVPLVDVVRAWAHLGPPGGDDSTTADRPGPRRTGDDIPAPASFSGPDAAVILRRVSEDVHCAVRRAWRDYLAPPPPDVLAPPLTLDQSGASAHLIRSPLSIVRLRLGSPLEFVATLPWEWVAAPGGAVVFIKALEAWANAPGRIRVENRRLKREAALDSERTLAELERLRAEQAAHRADAAEARKRELAALERIEELHAGYWESPWLERGSLDVPASSGGSGQPASAEPE